MANEDNYIDFTLCYEKKDFQCAAIVLYECLANIHLDDIILDPLYKSNLEVLLAEMHKEGIKIESSSSFYNILDKIYWIVTATGDFDLNRRYN